MNEMITNSIGAVTEGTTDALIANIPVVIVAVVGIAISFKLIKLGLRWVFRSVDTDYELTQDDEWEMDAQRRGFKNGAEYEAFLQNEDRDKF